MLFALPYLIVSVIVYVWAFRFILQQDKGFKTYDVHPEMKEVRPDDPLLTIHFDGSSSAPSSDESPDLGFSRFLADHGAHDWDNDDT